MTKREAIDHERVLERRRSWSKFERLKRLVDSGVSVPAAARAVGLSERTARRWLENGSPGYRRGEQKQPTRVPDHVRQALLERAESTPILKLQGYADWVRENHCVAVGTSWVHALFVRNGLASRIKECKPFKLDFDPVAGLQRSLDRLFDGGLHAIASLSSLRDETGALIFAPGVPLRVGMEKLRQLRNRQRASDSSFVGEVAGEPVLRRGRVIWRSSILDDLEAPAQVAQKTAS